MKKDRQYSQTTVVKMCTFTEENDSCVFTVFILKNMLSFINNLRNRFFSMHAMKTPLFHTVFSGKNASFPHRSKL